MTTKPTKSPKPKAAAAKKPAKAKAAPEQVLRALDQDKPAYEQLDPLHQRFVDEYVIDFNATQAYLRAGYTCTEETARRNASRLLTNADIQRAIKERNEACGVRLQAEVTKDEIVLDLARVLRADPNELTQLRRVCCRHCHGREHRYQWTPAEYELVQEERRQKLRQARDEDWREFELDPAGGLDYDPRKPPVPECPECHGQGIDELHFADTRKLGPEGRALYAGVKMTRTGPEIVMRSKDKAVELLARHLGMLNDKMLHSIPKDDPLAALLRDLTGHSFKPVPMEKEGQDDAD